MKDLTWKKILTAVTAIIHCVIQVINKWKTFLKRYKVVVDNNSKTGNEKYTWKHLETFNSVYGNKASTKLQSYYDSTSTCTSTSSCGKFVKACGEDSDRLDPPKDKSTPKVIRSKTKKRKIDGSIAEKISQIEQTASETLKELKEHNAKSLERLDRFLDIFEKSVNEKKNTQ